MLCLDAHVHCGIQDTNYLQAFEDYLLSIKGSPIIGASLFSPIIEIYNRWNTEFKDTPEWQQKRKLSNEYLLTINTNGFEAFPFLFIWNDFAIEDLTEQHRGIKWHRHANEPVYHYDDPRCLRAVKEIRKRNLPVIFEEELSNTIRFVEKLASQVVVIIPHMGFLNGGYRVLVRYGVFKRPNVYVDTSLASTGEIMDYIDRYGHERILFGSDFPFGNPHSELDKILRLPISQEKREAIAGLNLQRLMFQSNG